jgi:geranylgeranyl transferase type-2 subunit beta
MHVSTTQISFTTKIMENANESDHETNAMEVLHLFSDSVPFYGGLHVQYVERLLTALNEPASYEGALTDHLKMSGIYWSLAALSILRPGQVVSRIFHQQNLVDWVWSCYDASSGGFGGNFYTVVNDGGSDVTRPHDGHLLYTLSALQILVILSADGHNEQSSYHYQEDERYVRHRDDIIEFLLRRQSSSAGFDGCSCCTGSDYCGEQDTRFIYCALASLALLKALPGQESRAATTISIPRIQDFVDQCVQYLLYARNLEYDGSFGSVAGAESHAGQVFCCVAALSIAQAIEPAFVRSPASDTANGGKGTVDFNADLLGSWLCERQCDSGGLNGRSEKQADVCYSWWIVSALCILGKLDWINTRKLANFILLAQDPDDGGIADRPEDMVDVFHTFFGIAGLSLLGFLHHDQQLFRPIDPIYALPTDVVRQMQLPGQVLVEDRSVTIDRRLGHYQVVHAYDDDAPSE